MKKRLLLFLLIGLLLTSLSACKGTDSSSASGNNKQPVGLYMLEYFCDSNGEYVPEFNEEPDYDGYPTTELERLYIDKKTYWCEVLEDGTGKYHTPFQGDEEMNLVLNFKENQFEYDDYMFYDFHYDPDNDVFWYGADDFWYRMRKCTQEEIDDVYAGKGGSVAIDKAEIGDLVCLGNYDTYPYNEETEPLYWRVIDKKDGKILILCDKLIDSFSFNYNPNLSNLNQVTWENSSLREFLNNEFLDMMFTEEEKALVQTSINENKAANEKLLEQWGSFEDQDGIPYSEQTYQVKEDDPDTEDKVFLLSYQEVLKYFGEPTEEYEGNGGYPYTIMKANPKWKALVTKTVDENKIGYYEFDTRYGAWMTRTLSTALNEDGPLVTYITSEGEVFNYYTYTPMFIRPAMWITQ